MAWQVLLLMWLLNIMVRQQTLIHKEVGQQRAASVLHNVVSCKHTGGQQLLSSVWGQTERLTETVGWIVSSQSSEIIIWFYFLCGKIYTWCQCMINHMECFLLYILTMAFIEKQTGMIKQGRHNESSKINNNIHYTFSDLKPLSGDHYCAFQNQNKSLWQK